jgi:AraC-like DNA-binding protein
MDKRKLGVADLALLELLFAPLIDNPFFIKNEKLQYVAVNEAMLRLCGVSHRKDLIGRTAWQIYPPQSASRYDIDEHLVLSGQTIVDRLEMITVTNRAPAWLLFSQFPIRDQQQKIVGIAGVSRRLDLRRFDSEAYTRIASAILHIRENFARPLNLKRLCEVCGSSSSQIERDFARLLHISPHAMEMLAQDRPVAKVAHDCGFSDHSAFTRRFREHLGMSPTAYLKNLSGR